MRSMKEHLQRLWHNEIKAAYAQIDEMALGAVQALEAAGRLSEVVVVGVDSQKTAFELARAGKLAAIFKYPLMAPERMQIAYQVVKGEKVDAEVILLGQ